MTELLHEWSAGRRDAFDQLFPLVYDELRRLAGQHLRRERGPRTVQTTEGRTAFEVGSAILSGKPGSFPRRFRRARRPTLQRF